jgi:hypothetical protein
MASRIVPTNIDVTYPIAGQDNDTKGFRDNFSSIRNNFSVAASEISTIQSTLSVVPTYTTAPISSTSIGTAGQIAADSSNFYVCTANNTWATIPYGIPLPTFRTANLSASSNVTITATDSIIVLDSTIGGTIARANIFLPSNVGLTNGQTLTIASNITVTSAVLIKGTNTALYGNTATNAYTPNTSFRWIYNSARANWYRI